MIVMNILSLLLFAGVSQLLGETVTMSDEATRIEMEQVMIWDGKLREFANQDPNVKFLELEIGLRNMGYRASLADHGSGVDRIYEKIQNELMVIPGHARYYRDEIERERKTVEHLDRNQGERSNYNRNRKWHFETLAHLPSPETIGVLGGFLADDRDKSHLGVENLDHIPGNSAWSVMALSGIGLRQPPVDGFHYFEEGDVQKWRGWWEEIKSGRKTFSFRGQSVEYRFRPDGTWETLRMTGGRSPPKPEHRRESASALTRLNRMNETSLRAGGARGCGARERHWLRCWDGWCCAWAGLNRPEKREGRWGEQSYVFHECDL